MTLGPRDDQIEASERLKVPRGTLAYDPLGEEVGVPISRTDWSLLMERVQKCSDTTSTDLWLGFATLAYGTALGTFTSWLILMGGPGKFSYTLGVFLVTLSGFSALLGVVCTAGYFSKRNAVSERVSDTLAEMRRYHDPGLADP